MSMIRFIKLSNKQMEWKIAKDIKPEINRIVRKLEWFHIDPKRIICFRGYGSKSKARARIWSFPKIWQLALSLKPHYIIEVMPKYFDKLSSDERKKVLIHELLHIPKNFSGSLIPHKTRSS